MRIKSLIAAAAILITASSAFAEATDGAAPDASIKSVLSRAQVVEQLRQAKASGEIQLGELYGSQRPTLRSSKSRAQVVAEVKAARANGNNVLAELYGEQAPTFSGTRTRQSVQAKALAFTKHSVLPFGGETYTGG